jgi:hypothetical protein
MQKGALRALALVMVLLLAGIAIPVWAYQGSLGSSPYAANLLISGLNTGTLDPGQEYWYAYSRVDLGDPDYNSIILSLNFEAQGNAVASRVNFQVFTFNQVEAWLKDNSGPIDNLGLGTPASADFDVNTGERLWAGSVATNEVYYVRIFNLSPSPVRFRLTALGQKNRVAEGFMNAQASGMSETTVIPAAVNIPGRTSETGSISPSAALPIQPLDDSPAATSWLLAAQAIQGLPPQEAAAWLMSAARLGWLPGAGGGIGQEASTVPVNPNAAAPLVADDGDEDDQPGATAAVPAEPRPDPYLGESIYPNRPLTLLDSPNTGRLAPKSEHWYTFTPGKVDGKLIENFSLTMFFTPGEPNLARHVTFEMFTGSQYQIWMRGTPQDMEHFGAGSWVSRDGDYITGERLWHGTVVDGDQYFVKISNDTNKWIDYHLVPGDIINIEMDGPAKEIKAVASEVASAEAPTGRDIGSPLPFYKNRATGKLPAGQDLWFSFRTPNTNRAGFDFLPYLVELSHRPGIGSVANGVNVEIYPFQDQHIWRRGDTDQIRPLGVGSYTTYNEAGDMHTWVWDGHLVSNTIYFIRIKNVSPQEIDYDLVMKQRL